MTDYDVVRGRIGYISMIPNFMVTEISIELTRETGSTCTATVRYTRTALVDEANELVSRFSQHFADQGPHWEAAINAAIAKGERP